MKLFSNKGYEQAIASAIEATRSQIVEDVTKAMKGQAQSGPASFVAAINPVGYGNGGRGEVESTSKEDYLRTLQSHPWTRAAIRRISLAAVANKWGFTEAEGYEGKANEANKKYLQDLFRRPNKRYSFTSLYKVTFDLLKSKGECYWEVVRNGKGDPVEFYYLQGKIDILCDVHGNLSSPAYRQRLANGSYVDFEAEDIIAFRLPNAFGGMHGTSDMEALELPLAIDLNSLRWNNNFFGNNAMPPGVWELPAEVQPDQAKEILANLEAQVKGVQNASRSAVVTSGGVKFNPIQTAPKDLEFTQGREQVRDEILAVLGVPKSRLGLTDGVNYASSQAQAQLFYSDEVEPLQLIVEETINQWIADELGIEDWSFRFNRPDFTNSQVDAKVNETYLKYACMTVNEVRTKMGLEPFPYAWADTPFLVTGQGAQFMTDGIEKPVEAPTASAEVEVKQEPEEEKEAPPEDLKEVKSILSTLRKSISSLLPRGGVANV